MFVIFMIKQNPETVYITTRGYFSQFMQDLQVKLNDVIWNGVTLESLIMLKDKQSNYLVLNKLTQPKVI